MEVDDGNATEDSIISSSSFSYDDDDVGSSSSSLFSSFSLFSPMNSSSISSSSPISVLPGIMLTSDETLFELILGGLLGLAFLMTAIVAARRMSMSRKQQHLDGRSTTSGSSSSGSSGGAETTVVTAFYSLICATGMLRSLWFLIPTSIWQPKSYTPEAIYAFGDEDKTHWERAALSEIIITFGSLTLFSIFILILVYWADILKKYFHPGARRILPMYAFFAFVGTLLVLECCNILLFLCQYYTTEGMILFNAILLAVVSIVCVCEITIFSHRFRTVLKTLGAINQVSTDSQVKRIVWITVTGNLFFFTRAVLETFFAASLIFYYTRHGSVAKQFSHLTWDIYSFLVYWSEVTILALMLYILQTRFTQTSSASSAASSQGAGPGRAGGSSFASKLRPGAGGPAAGGYTKIPDADVQQPPQPPTYNAVV